MLKVFKPADFNMGVQMVSTGRYLPANVLSNAQLCAAGGPLTEAEIVRLSGILTRHRAAPEQATSDLAIEAARVAIRRSGLSQDAIDRLVLATVSPDYSSPSTACIVHQGLQLNPCPAFDLAATCSGFVYTLENAARAVVTGDNAVLAIAAEARSRFVNPQDRSTFALFGDGAGAAVLCRGEPNQGLLGVATGARGSKGHSVYVPAGGSREPASQQTVSAGRHVLHMEDGPQVYFDAVEGMLGIAESMLEAFGLGWGDIACLIPHQANLRLIDRIAKLAGISRNKVFTNVERVGNVSGASIAIALDEALGSDLIHPGDLVLLVAAGAGYTSGAALLKADSALLERARQP